MDDKQILDLVLGAALEAAISETSKKYGKVLQIHSL